MSEPGSSIEAFAWAAARLSDPFADRAELFAAMELDERRWLSIEAAWRTEIQRQSASGDRALADAFAVAFASERQRLIEQRGRASRVGDVTADDKPGHDDVDATAMVEAVLKPALPFAGSRAAPPPAVADNGPSPSEPCADLDGTALLEGDPLDTTLPFKKD